MVALNIISEMNDIGKAYYLQLLSDHRAKLESGCVDCCDDKLECLNSVIQALNYDIVGQYNTDTTQALYKCLLDLTSTFAVNDIVPTYPQAGTYRLVNNSNIDTSYFIDSSFSLPAGQSVNSQFILGDSLLGQIAFGQKLNFTRYLADGTVDLTLELTNPPSTQFNTSIMDLTKSYEFIYSNETSGEKIAFFGAIDTKTVLTQSQITAGSMTTFYTMGSVKIPYNVPDSKFMWFAIPHGEPIKNRFQDLENLNNNGPIGDESSFYDAPVVSGMFDFYITNYETTYSYPSNPDAGLEFSTI